MVALKNNRFITTKRALLAPKFDIDAMATYFMGS
jgi:hypothetical protein